MLDEQATNGDLSGCVCGCVGGDGRVVLGGSESGEVFFWDLVEAHVVHRLQASGPYLDRSN
jgi:hypothetical protein